MQRCIELALLGAGAVAPNPMVGAVLVYNDRIIGEGYHKQYGEGHAEVNCINAVAAADIYLIEKATLYVSLEPCAHFGKTPPCADLIIKHKIPTVVIGCRDPFDKVAGKGIEKLQRAGLTVLFPVLENECQQLNKRFITFHTKGRPYIVLKWAQTADGFLGKNNHGRLLISNEYSNRLVHKWRSEEAAIMVGTNTALTDNPSLTTRLWAGQKPVRVVIDRQLRLPASLQIFDNSARTVVFNDLKHDETGHISYYQCNKHNSFLAQVCDALYRLNIQSVLVEGGPTLLQSFIDENIFDQIRIITSTNLFESAGIRVPLIPHLQLCNSLQLQSDRIQFFNPAL